MAEGCGMINGFGWFLLISVIIIICIVLILIWLGYEVTESIFPLRTTIKKGWARMTDWSDAFTSSKTKNVQRQERFVSYNEPMKATPNNDPVFVVSESSLIGHSPGSAAMNAMRLTAFTKDLDTTQASLRSNSNGIVRAPETADMLLYKPDYTKMGINPASNNALIRSSTGSTNFGTDIGSRRM